jgi:ABC-type nickel/cobalt efflux system permease component RcnA/Tol biopolymer transport system component
VIQNRDLINDQSDLLSSWDSGKPVLPNQQKDIVTQTAEQVVPELAERTPQEILMDLVRRQEFSVSFYLFALAISFALGALHALTPGHGKTVVAAYLVGSRGTAKHTIALGSIVTLTHTGSVFLLGIITLAASQYILPTSIIPWLEVISGLIIVGLGLYLLWQRFKGWREQTGKPKRSIKSISIAESKSSFLSIRRNEHNHSHTYGTDHHHARGHDHSHEIPETITWRSLITLGISGGLVPCPDAIAILLVAIAINRILLGLALIISFSLGLAIILIIIGLLMVNGSRLFTRIDSLNKVAPALPVVSAAIVLVLGFGLTYGAITKINGNSLSPVAARRFIEEAQIIYLNTDENESKQLFIVDTKGNSPRQLTNSTTRIMDYAIAPNQNQLVYLEETQELNYNFWIIDLNNEEKRKVASCKEAECGQPVWSPDSQHVMYEHLSVNADGTTTGISSLWWFDIKSGEAKSVFQEERLPGTNPSWSPNGEWLTYTTPQGIHLYNLENSESRLIKNLLGQAVQWSPDSKSILLRDVIIKDNQFVTQLFLYDPSSETLTNLNADENFENILAAWSPDGEFIAVIRRDLSIERGDQMWIMEADGNNAHAITDAPAVLHGNLSWSPDGNYLLYDLYLLDTFPIESRVEILNIKTGEVINLGAEGYNPQWVWNK